MRTGTLFAAVAALALQPIAAHAQAPSVAYSALPAAGAVDAFYAGWRYAPIWFSGKTAKPAVQQLLQILNRAPVDGLASGRSSPRRSKPRSSRRAPAIRTRSRPP